MGSAASGARPKSTSTSVKILRVDQNVYTVKQHGKALIYFNACSTFYHSIAIICDHLSMENLSDRACDLQGTNS